MNFNIGAYIYSKVLSSARRYAQMINSASLSSGMLEGTVAQYVKGFDFFRDEYETIDKAVDAIAKDALCGLLGMTIEELDASIRDARISQTTVNTDAFFELAESLINETYDEEAFYNAERILSRCAAV